MIGLALKHTAPEEPVELSYEAPDAAVGVASFVLSLRSRGVRDLAVLRAMEQVPREIFAPARFADLSRNDVALPLPCGQTMTAPGTVAAMLAALGLEPGQRVLEIGTGSGYVTALLLALGAQIRSVERYGVLVESAKQHLKVAGFAGDVRIETADGLAPRPRERFDRILLNGALSRVPEALAAFLSPGGRLVGALSADGSPRLMRLDRAQDGGLQQEIGPAMRIAPLACGPAASL